MSVFSTPMMASSSFLVRQKQRTLFTLCAWVMVLTFTLSANLLNVFIPYSEAGGNFLTKFHPATWVSGVILFYLFSSHLPFVVRPYHPKMTWGVVFFLIIFLGLKGKGSFASTLIDIYLAPMILCLAFSYLEREDVRKLLAIFVWIAAFNVPIVTLEFLIKTSLIPMERQELIFRPLGLFAHPIVAGTLFYCAMLLALSGVVASFWARPLMVFFVFAIVLCGVRGPLGIAGGIFALHLLQPRIPREKVSDYIFDFGIVIFLPLLLFIAFSLGAFDRIAERGVWEESSQSRFFIYEALDFLTDEQWRNGLETYEEAEELAVATTGTKNIENTFVAMVFQAGFMAGVLIVLSLVLLHFRAMLRYWFFGVIVIFVSQTTIGFSVKNMTSAGIMFLGVWIWRQGESEPEGAIA